MSGIISDCGLYRYRLERGAGRTMAILMVNPSTAAAENDESTIRKVLVFADGRDCTRVIGNKFAFRATDVNDLRAARDPTGPDNDRHIEQVLRDGDLHVAAWGSLNKLPDTLRSRWYDVVRLADRVGCRLHCIGTNADRHPKHPFMTVYSMPMTEWTVPWFAGRGEVAA